MGGLNLRFDYGGIRYVCDFMAYYLGFVVLPNGTILEIAWTEKRPIAPLLMVPVEWYSKLPIASLVSKYGAVEAYYDI